MNRLIEAVKGSILGPAEMTGPGTITGRYSFAEDFLGFSGHFPGYPILPAVVQLIAAQCLVEEQKGHPIKPSSVKNAKFLQEIPPGREIMIKCADCTVKGEKGSKIEVHLGEKRAASFLMTYSG